MQERVGVRALSALLVTMAVYLLIWQLLVSYVALPIYFYGRLIEVLAMILFVVLATVTPMRFDKMGIAVSRGVLVRSLATGAVLSLLFVVFLMTASLLRHGSVLFDAHLTDDVSQLTYFLVAPFQEILAKSVMLYSFEMIFGEKHPHLAVLMSSLMFGAFHVVYGIRMMVLAILLSLVTGEMFLRERCVWGCGLLHFACGFFSAGFGL
jgi:hypothetical protein